MTKRSLVRPIAGGVFAVLTLATLAAPARERNRDTGREKAPVSTRPDECARRYGAALERIASDALPQITAAAPSSAAAVAGDPALPGAPLFVAQSRPRTKAEIAALAAATALARSRGRSTGIVAPDSDRAWIAGRLREDLTDYLGQKPTPYLCSGVEAYLDTLRGFARRLGPTANRREEWIATQRAVARRSVAGAEAAIAAAKATAVNQSTTIDANGTADAPTVAQATMTLNGSADIAAATDRLIDAATRAGLATSAATPAAETDMTRPALARLRTAKPYVMAARPLVEDRPVRTRMLAAFADLEALDYLVNSEAVRPDPAALAIDATLDAIAKAQAENCTCKQ